MLPTVQVYVMDALQILLKIENYTFSYFNSTATMAQSFCIANLD